MNVSNFNMFENIITKDNYFIQLKQIAVSRFKWNNLPNSIPSRFIENKLFDHGQLAFIKDSKLGFMITKCTPEGINIYDEPLKWRCYGINYEKIYNPEEIVIINNNNLRVPTYPSILFYVDKIKEAEKGIRANIRNTKSQFIFLVNDKNKLSIKNLYKNYIEGEPVAYVDKGLELENIKIELTPTPFITDKLTWYKQEVFNECKSYLGVNNNQSQGKKERLVTNEVDVNNDEIYQNLMSFYNPRLEAAHEINNKFGLNIECECISNLPEYRETETLELMEVGESDE